MANTIKEPGIYDGVPMADYVADPCPEPSANKGTLLKIIQKKPLHAHYYHPRLGGNIEEISAAANLGSAAHTILLGGPEIESIDADNWRTKAAREARDTAISEGKIPLLAKQYGIAYLMADTAQKTLGQLVNPLADGDAEQTMLWQEDNTWCRARFDWLSKDRALAIDYKTTIDANVAKWIRNSLVPFGYDLGVAHYRRGVEQLAFVAPRFLFLIQENKPPYACSIAELGERHLEFARAKWNFSMRIWRECTASGKWPGYTGIHVTDPPQYDEWSFSDRVLLEDNPEGREV